MTETTPTSITQHQTNKTHGRGAPRIPQDEAISLMRAANFETLEPYPGFAKPWACRCMVCGRKSTPRYVNVKAGSRCRFRCQPRRQNAKPQTIFGAKTTTDRGGIKPPPQPRRTSADQSIIDLIDLATGNHENDGHNPSTLRVVDGMNALDPEFVEGLINTVPTPGWCDAYQTTYRANALYHAGFVLNLDSVYYTTDLNPFTADSMAQQCGSDWGCIDMCYPDELCDMTEVDFTLNLRGLNLTTKAVVVSVTRPRKYGHREEGLLLGIICFLLDNIETRGREEAKRYECDGRYVDKYHGGCEDVCTGECENYDDDILASAFHAIFPGYRR